MTPTQIKVIQTFRTRLQAIDPSIFHRGWYDMVLINVGRVNTHNGKISTKDLSNVGFERVMAFLEEQLDRAGSKPGTFWRDKERRVAHFLSSRQEWEIKQLYGELQAAGVTYTLGSIVDRMSVHRTSDVTQLNPSEAFKVIEMLKDVVSRQKVIAE